MPAPSGAGWTEAGGTPHFKVYYDAIFGALGAQLGTVILDTAERDYQVVKGVFSASDPAAYLPFGIYLIGGDGGAYHVFPDFGDIYVYAYDGIEDDQLRMLVVAEIVEVFQVVQNAGWDPGSSNGEALSRAIAEELYPTQIDGYVTAPTWLASKARPDWVSSTYPSDTDKTSIGCGILFLYYLVYQLRFPWTQVVQAAGPTLAQTYRALTGSSGAFAAFTTAVSRDFPAGATVGLPADNPFPSGGAAVISAQPGRVDAFLRVGAAMAHLRYPGPDGFELTGLHGDLAGEAYPAAVGWAPGRADVFARGRDGRLVHWWSGDDMVTFPPPEELGTMQLYSAPSAVSTAPGRLDVFAQGDGNTLVHWRYPSAGGGPFSAGEVISAAGQVYSAPGAAASAVRIEVFAVGPDDGLWHWYSTDDGITFSDPASLGGGVRLGATQPAAVFGPGTLDVFARDYTSALHRWSYQNPSFGPSVSAVGGQQTFGRPAAAIWAPADGSVPELHLFATGFDGNLWHWWTSPGPDDLSGPENLGGPLLSPPAASTWAPGRLDVFGQSASNAGALLHWWYDVGGWGGPEALPI
jgi:hypothetical protein